MNESLCQDCLRPVPRHPTNEGVCVCGGGTCGCEGCLETLRKLRAGERNWRELGLRVPITGWSESEGCQTQDKGR